VGVFESIDIPLRTIFCANGDLDALYDEGRIDEDLYILMGTAEVCVPALRDCVLDIAVLAQQMVVDIIREKGMSTVSRFEASARDFLSKQPWDNNYEQLRLTVRQVMESNPGEVLMLSAVTSALQSAMLASPRARFEARLSRARVDYVRATSILLGGDKAKVAAFFGTDTTVVGATLK
jgi:DNA-binding NtrC family response regulator